ncbi:dephospho-CoA kinase [Mycoplasma phocoenae]|uniref:Dephospho-CoA kinase n=1 Tax=Mycoplasma phocoenae TaxID=754517 RepID=A0A858U916_9MOLU|nr:dephospho-CoA kinase [Mycoplasma phocoenae]QJG67196.1 dephospho-CoA kinase [Mycoplasma phocoenae]
MIAIIGKSGVGKTTFLKKLEKHGFKVLIADEFVNELYKKGNLGYKKIKHTLGEKYVDENGVNKKALKESINLNLDFINEVEELIFPIIENHLKITNYDFVEMSNIFSKNANFLPYFSKIIQISIPEENRVKNLKKRNVNNYDKNIIDALNKGFFTNDIVNISSENVEEKIFFKMFFKIVFGLH